MKTKSTSQTARKPARKNAILLTIAALGLCVWSAGAPAICLQTTTWNYAGSGSWFDPTKWNNGVPDSNKEAFINNAGTANIDSTGAAACNLTLGYNMADSGNVSIGGGTLTLSVTNDVEIGAYGKGTLSITNGARVTAGLLTIAALQGNSGQLSVGTVTVDGATFTISGRADIGGDNPTPGGIGLLSVTNGGTVSAATVRVYSSGTLTGNGTVTVGSGSGTATVDGTVSPNGAGGTLNFGGGLQLNSAATTQCKVTPQDPSTTPQVSVSAQVSLGGRLSVTMTGDFSSAPTRFTLLYADSVAVGHITFGSTSITYPTGQGCWVPQITYDYTGGHVHVYLDRVINCN